MKQFTEKEIQNRLSNVRGIDAIEGIEVPKEIEELSAQVLRGKISFEDAMKTLISNYGEE